MWSRLNLPSYSKVIDLILLSLCGFLLFLLEISVKMPAGTSWPSYIGAAVCAMLSMFAGAQTVHMLYKPLQDMDAKVELEKQRIKEFTSTTENSKENIS